MTGKHIVVRIGGVPHMWLNVSGESDDRIQDLIGELRVTEYPEPINGQQVEFALEPCDICGIPAVHPQEDPQ
jgi:hypothetical protein